MVVSSEQIEKLLAYAALVTKWGRVHNLTAAADSASFVDEHIVDCMGTIPHVRGPRLLDIGSGAGLPGIVLAILRPELKLSLLERRAKRARFLTQARIALQLDNVEVAATPVEHHRPSSPYDEIIARAYGPLARLLEDTRHLQQRGTRILAMKGADPAAEIALCDRARYAIAYHQLSVPGFDYRHLIVVECQPQTL